MSALRLDPSNQARSPIASRASALDRDDGVILPGSAYAIYDMASEQSLLGSVLINPATLLDRAVAAIQPDDFYLIKHRWIWLAFQTLAETRQPIDVLTVARELNRHNHLDEAGGQAYLTELVTVVPTSIHAEGYAVLVATDSTKRRLLAGASDIAALAYSEATDPTALSAAAMAVVNRVAVRHRNRSAAQSLGAAVQNYRAKVEARIGQPEEPIGIRTGIPDLDDVTKGLKGGDLVIVAGRPGSGKTAFMLGVARRAAKEGKRVAYFSLEMSNEQLVNRLVSQETGIDAQRLLMGRISGDEIRVFADATDALFGLPLIMDDTPAVTPSYVRIESMSVVQDGDLDLIVVDYLQIMHADTAHPNNRPLEVGEISAALKALARELNVPVLAGAQLSRAVEQRADKRPMLSDLRESGSLEQDADIVLFPHPLQGNDRATPVEIIVAKHRNGPTHSGVSAVFLKASTSFEPAVGARFADWDIEIEGA